MNALVDPDDGGNSRSDGGSVLRGRCVGKGVQVRLDLVELSDVLCAGDRDDSKRSSSVTASILENLGSRSGFADDRLENLLLLAECGVAVARTILEDGSA